MNILRRYGRIACIGYAVVISLFGVGLWGLHSYGYLWAAKLDHDSWASRGSDLLARGHREQAERQYRALLTVHPHSPTGWAGLLESRRNRWSESNEALEIANEAREALKNTHATTGDLLYVRVQFENWRVSPDENSEALAQAKEILGALETSGGLPAEGWHLRSHIAFENGMAASFVDALQRLAEAPLEGSSDIYRRQRDQAITVSGAADDAVDTERKVRAYMGLGEWENIRSALSSGDVAPTGTMGYLSGIVSEIEGNLAEAERIYSRLASASSEGPNGPRRAMDRLRREHGRDGFERSGPNE